MRERQVIMFVNLADDPDLPEEIDSLPLVQIISERGYLRRTIGIEQVTRAVLEVATFLEQHSEYVPFRVEIWEGNEPDAPPIQDRRRRTKTSRQEG